ncbi:hypothetical protein QFZ82_004803 [Streptomyces sp. V4I23]|uniref:hypothetical protein n=1 Tax=Streptomyces sp. V4I23 TaxID=3042282 RepID=UPI00277F6446|nr:hypothetical protein [Streptomyces sp. V4I23]MDQ1010318.1 hypothetical protein [Streptomyces sp. V4I23]
MHGPGYAPPQPPREVSASVIVLRVLFALMPVISCGLLSWATMLRLAVVTRRPRDWALFAATVLAVAVCFGMVMSDPTADLELPRSNVAIAVLLAIGVLVVTYYLFAETKHFATRPQAYYGPHPHPQPHFGYGYPPPSATAPAHGSPCTTPPLHAQPQPAPAPQPQVPPQTPPLTAPVPQPQAAPRPAPASEPPRSGRIDQVRAELDELSDLLRKEEDR